MELGSECKEPTLATKSSRLRPERRGTPSQRAAAGGQYATHTSKKWHHTVNSLSCVNEPHIHVQATKKPPEGN